MPRVHTPFWRSLEHWRATLFLAAGVLFVGHATVRGIEAFTAMPPPVDVFGPTGYVAAILGLLGLYPSIADPTPRMSRIAAVLAIATACSWGLIAGLSFGEAAGMLPPQTDILPGMFFVVVIVSTLTMYLLFGVAEIRGGIHTRTVGFLLLAPAALLVLLIVGAVLLSMTSAAGGVLVGGGMAILHWAIGGTLLTGPTQIDQVDSSADVSAE